MADAGLDLRARFGIAPGTTDFFGGQLGLRTGFDIGAHELPELAAAGIDEIVLIASSAATIAGAWRRVTDATAAGGARLHHPNQGDAKLAAPLSEPANYFELTFEADAGKPYRLWMRARAEGEHVEQRVGLRAVLELRGRHRRAYSAASAPHPRRR